MKPKGEWGRRAFLQALAALSIPAASIARGVRRRSDGAPYATDLGNGVWAIGNDWLEQRLTFSSGGLFTTSLQHKAGARDWCTLGASPVFFVREEDTDLNSAAGWTFTSFDVSASSDEATLRIGVQHSVRPIRIHAYFHVWADAPVVRTWTEYENVGATTRTLQGQSFGCLTLDPSGDLEAVWVGPFSWLWPYTNDAFVVHHETLSANQQRRLVIGPYAAEDVAERADPATYRAACGWFVFHRPALAAGLFGGVEWSGACEAHLALDGSGRGVIDVAHGLPTFTHQTAPGERVTSPVAFVGLFGGPLDEATHLAHTLAKQHCIPPRPSIRVPVGAQFPYVVADTWGYGPNIDETGLRAFIDRAATLGVEAVTIDEGWEARIGDWVSQPVRFPSGLRATVDAIHAKGMAAGLWFAFANVDPNSAVAQAHPDWLATQAGVPIAGSFDSSVLCLSHLPARAWVAEQFDRLVAEYDVDYFAQDFETIARCDNPAHGHQPGDGEAHNVRALWDLIDGVRARHPNVLIENNWSGARVMDFGMLRRYDMALCDDYNQAARNRGAAFGVTHFFPPAFVSKYMGAEALPPDYQTRSFFFGGPWNLMVDLLAQDAGALAEAVQAYKVLRELVRDGRVYHLLAPSFNGLGWTRYQIAWDAIEAVTPDRQRAVLFAGRGLAGPDTFVVKPRGLDPVLTYDLIASSGAAYGRRSGADLMANGLELGLPERAHETVVFTQLTHSIFLPAIHGS